MNDKGKLKHHVHLLVFLRGETKEDDKVVAHIITRKSRFDKDAKRLCRNFRGNYLGWAVTEDYWREHGGVKGRP